MKKQIEKKRIFIRFYSAIVDGLINLTLKFALLTLPAAASVDSKAISISSPSDKSVIMLPL